MAKDMRMRKKKSSLTWLVAPKCDTGWEKGEVFNDLAFDTRVHIIKMMYPKFNPTSAKVYTGAEYTAEWFNSLTGDQKLSAVISCMHPERTRTDDMPVEPAPQLIDFYTPVTEDNAANWYASCPEHLRKSIDKELDQLPCAEDAPTSDPVYIKVAEVWGSRPVVKMGDEEVMSSYAEHHWLEEWVQLYDKIQLIDTVLKVAPRMQKERKMLSQALGLKQGGNGLPSQAEGLDTTQAATVRWLESSGETPLEYLTSVYRDDTPDVRVSDKIAAARALLDYVHRKVPATIEVKGPSSDDINEHAAIARDIGEQLAKYAAITKKSEK